MLLKIIDNNHDLKTQINKTIIFNQRWKLLLSATEIKANKIGRLFPNVENRSTCFCIQNIHKIVTIFLSSILFTLKISLCKAIFKGGIPCVHLICSD